ncbi:MAG TPA: amidohydrolase family protein [Acidimicrobiales bacterium]|nr:amidohydrolase family protein [Acidimicrobiales bacterium]
MDDGLIWTNSGDSHCIEPPNLYRDRMPPAYAERMPRSEFVDGDIVTHIDGKTITRRAPGGAKLEMIEAIRAQGGNDNSKRLDDLDSQGVWGEVVFPSLGLWYGELETPDVAKAAAEVLNDWVAEEIMSLSPRLVPCATLPLQSVEYSLGEVERCVALGYKAVFLPTKPPVQHGEWNRPVWEPLWELLEGTGTVLAFHIGTESGERPQKYRGPGGYMLNYVNTTFGGQIAVVMMIASGALERHPDLKVLVSEGGATWGPFLGDRMNEALRQHHMFDEKNLTMLPKEYLLRQVYASFQHDETAVPTVTAMGWQNVMFGSDYPHLEGTFPHTQKVLHELFDDVDEAVSERIRIGAFLDLFPHVGRPPAA